MTQARKAQSVASTALGLLLLAGCLHVALGHFVETEQCPVENGASSETCRAPQQACEHCSGHGTCTSPNSPCVCDLGYEGNNCNALKNCSHFGGCVHGVCVLGGLCSCDPGWGGDNCSTASCPKDCNGHGVCDTLTGLCSCDAGWSGRSCSLKLCVGNCTAGQGECNDGECVCYEGWSGPDCAEYTCKNDCFASQRNGVCDKENRRCMCSPYWTGEDCSMALCPNDCSGHGACLDGICECDADWTGFSCASKLCVGRCSGHGTCNGEDGICECQSGFVGDECQWRASCLMPCVHGSCVSQITANATCVCDFGWVGDACDQLSLQQPLQLVLPCPSNCTGHGTCQTNGTCACDAGWSQLADCSELLPNFAIDLNVTCPLSCSGHGSCMQGQCMCDPGYTGVACELQGGDAFCARNCSSGAGLYHNGTCFCSETGISGCVWNCSGHGMCSGPRANDTCLCDFGFGGLGCGDILLTHYVDTQLLLSGGCAGNCSGHGSCANGTCACDVDWLGADCSLISSAATGSVCPGNCSSRGACTGNNTCLCDIGFVGITCETASWAAGCLLNCSSRGSCTVNDTCACDLGFTGVYCEVVESLFLGSTPVPVAAANNWTSACPRGCSGHGACVAEVCMCDPFFVGSSCELAIIMPEFPVAWPMLPTLACPNNCTEMGICVNGTCVCDAGRAGDDCSKMASLGDLLLMPCPSACSGHGVCANGTCGCLIGWSGADCSRLSCPSDCSQHGMCQEDASCLCDPGWGGSGCETPLCPNGCTGQGACTQNGTCICYIGFEGDDCSVIADCSKRGTRVCGFCKCNPGYYGSLCERDRCGDSRKYQNQDVFQPIEVCSGHGSCSDFGCVCDPGYSGHNCSKTADCTGGSNGLQCSGHGTCSGGPGICQGQNDCPDQCTCDQKHDMVWDGVYCGKPLCPGPEITLQDGSTSINQCGGKGSCGISQASGNPVCQCVTSVEGSYKDLDCMTPPEYFISNYVPGVGPVEGHTHITLMGQGFDRIISRNHYISDWRNAEQYPSFFCKFEMSGDDGSRWTLPLTPIVWRATVVKNSVSASPDHLELRIGDRLIVYGCNPCDKTGTNSNARLIAGTMDGTIGLAPANLYYYDSAADWDTLTCSTPPSNVTGKADFSFVGSTIPPPIPGSKAITASDIDTSSAVQFEYYTYEIIQRVAPSKSPLRPVGGDRGPPDINRATTITIIGSYFPVHGTFACQFYDSVTLDTSCRSPAKRINTATISCTVPKMRRSRLLRVFVSSNSQQFEQGGIDLTIYSVRSIEPVCIPMLGVAVIRVRGNYLLPDASQSPQIKAYCRFGKVSSTLGSTSDDKLENWWAYHTIATPAADASGALECAAPPKGVYIATYDFSLSLDACECGKPGCPPCLVPWIVPLGGQNYFYGQWDSTIGAWHEATGLPKVEMRTVLAPVVESIFPTSGFMPGGTPVTLNGRNFETARCGWGLNAAPTCRFGTLVTTEVFFLSQAQVVCNSPQLPTGVESEVMVSLAIDGQSYVDGTNFMYVKAYGVKTVLPRSAPLVGGSTITVTGPGIQDFGDTILGPYRSTVRISCVFVMNTGMRRITPANFMNPTQVSCPTPESQYAQGARVFVSPNAMLEDSQMSLSSAPFFFYNVPVVSKIMDPFSSIHGGNVVNIEGSFFLDLDSAVCKFGDLIVPASFVTVNLMQCTVPAVSKPMSVKMQISLNGQDFSPDAVTFHYFDVERILPNKAPVRGNSRLVVQTTFAGNFTLASHVCMLRWPAKSTGPDYVDEEECLKRKGNWLPLVFEIGFGTSMVSLPGIAGPLRNQLVFDVPSPIVDANGHAILEPSQHEILITIGSEINQAFNFPKHTMLFYDLAAVCPSGYEEVPGQSGVCEKAKPFIRLPEKSVQKVSVNITTKRKMSGHNVTCKTKRYGPGYASIYHTIPIFDRHDDRDNTFGIDPVTEEPKLEDEKIKGKFGMNLFWGPTNLNRCSRNFRVTFDVQTGCKMGPLDTLNVQLQMTSARSSQCSVDDERCQFTRNEVSEVESGWWKSLYVCAGANYATEMDSTDHLVVPSDCGFGGFCGNTSQKARNTEVLFQPACPFPALGPGVGLETSEYFPLKQETPPFTASQSLSAADPLCTCNKDRQVKTLQDGITVSPFNLNCYAEGENTEQCMCTGDTGSCDCGGDFHTTGAYVLEDPFASSNLDCPVSNLTDCDGSALLKFSLKFQTSSPSFEYFRIRAMDMSCDSAFELFQGEMHEDGSTITCPLPSVYENSGVEGVIVQVSLNGLDWEEPLDFPHLKPPKVLSVKPRFGGHIGGTPVTVTGLNFVDIDSLSCSWLSGTGEEVFVDAIYIDSTQIICNAPPIPKDLLEPFSSLQYAVYVSLNGRHRGVTHVDGSSQERAFNYFRFPVLDFVAPDSGFTTMNQTITIFGTHMCLFFNSTVPSPSCRALRARMTYPPYCTASSASGCTQWDTKQEVEQLQFQEVHAQIWNMKAPAIMFGSAIESSREIGVQISIDETEVFHSYNFTIFNSSFPPDGCFPPDSSPLDLKCKCLFRNPEKSEIQYTPSSDLVDAIGNYEITDPSDVVQYEYLTSVPSRRFDLCQALPILTAGRPLVTSVMGGTELRFGARSLPDWKHWYDVPEFSALSKEYWRFSCVFQYTVYRGGSWRSELRLVNTTMRTRESDLAAAYVDTSFTWAPVKDAAKCPRSNGGHETECANLNADTAGSCGFEGFEKTGHDITHWPGSYRCFQCIIPPAGGKDQPLLQHDLEGAGGVPMSVKVNLLVLTRPYAPCHDETKKGRSCDLWGNEFEYHAHRANNLDPFFSSSSVFPGPFRIPRTVSLPAYSQSSIFPHHAGLDLVYAPYPTIVRVYPSVLPLNTTSKLRVDLNMSRLAPLQLKRLLSKETKCRLEQCFVHRCTSIHDCKCAGIDSSTPGIAAQEEEMCSVEYHSESSLVLHISKNAGGIAHSSMRAIALSFNGQEWFRSLNASIIFYHLPVAVSHKAAAQTVYSFGVDKLLDIEAGEYYRVAEAGRATPLISYMQEPKCTEADQADIDCVWRIPRASQQQGSSVAISTELEERPKPWEPQMVFRFSPGTCDAMSMQDYLSLGTGYELGPAYASQASAVDDNRGCCSTGRLDLDIYMNFSQMADGRFAQLRGTAPTEAAVGEYHLCFSLDGVFFIPMAYNYFTTHASIAQPTSYVPASSSIATFMFYNMSITGQSLFQGPSDTGGTPYHLTILGRGFPLPRTLALYAPKIRVKFGDAVLKSAASNEDPNIVTIESEGSIKVQVPTIELAASEQIRNVLVFVSIDNSVLHPPLGLTFTIFPQPVIRKWFPLYGLFETETRVTITGTRFTDTGEARCRFVGATCASEDGGSITPCVRRADYISDTTYVCAVPSRRAETNGQLNPSTQKMEFSVFAPEVLKADCVGATGCLYELLWRPAVRELSGVLYEQEFLFHKKFSRLVLDAFSAPVNSPEKGTDKRVLSIDATSQKWKKPGSEVTCLNFEDIHLQGSMKLGLRNDGAVVSTDMIPVQIDRVLMYIGRGGGCPRLEGFCVGEIRKLASGTDPPISYPTTLLCNPTQDTPNGKEDCCIGPGMDFLDVDGEDRGSCCPKLDDDRWQYDTNNVLRFNDQFLLNSAGLASLFDPKMDTISYIARLCKFPNWKKYPELVSEPSIEICPVTINWRLPTIKVCREGSRDSQWCQSDADCGGGRCIFMPMNTVLQVSTNAGQEFSGPSTSAILFFKPPQVLSTFPSRVVKDCGESQPGKLDCGWGQWWQDDIVKASDTECGKQSYCSKRQNVVFTLGTGLVSGQCSSCNDIYITQESFSNVKCRFAINENMQVLADGVYEGSSTGSTVTCESPVLMEPALVYVSVALDGSTFIGDLTKDGIDCDDPGNVCDKTTVVFIKRPEVTAVVPTNGIFDANTEISVTGKFFCNEAAAMPCSASAGSTDHWCIFDFKLVRPEQDVWSVNRKYTPAVVIDPQRLVCRAPVISPDVVPARPRALVGVILHGIFDSQLGILINPDDVLRSEAYYLYHARPTALRILPGAGAYMGGTLVTIAGSGIFDSYRGCFGGALNNEEDLPIGWPAYECDAIAQGRALVPKHKAYCRFDDQVVPALILVAQSATDPFNRNSLVCTSPAISDPSGSAQGYAVSDMTFSLNGKLDEFSNPIPYLYGAQKVQSLIPTSGSAGAAEMLTVRGTNFIDSPQLTCFFTPSVYSAWDARITKNGGTAQNPTFAYVAGQESLSSQRLATKAVYLDDEHVLCPIPAAWMYPLKCTCQCNDGMHNLCGTQQVQRNLVQYEYPAAAPWSPAAITQPIYSEKSVTEKIDSATCTADQSAVHFCDTTETDCDEMASRPSDRSEDTGALKAAGKGCQVRVQVGVNLQQLSHETEEVLYVYDMRIPKVISVMPTAGPVSGGTMLTIVGERFPPSDDDVNFVTPRCAFGPNLYTKTTRLDSKTLTCQTPAACVWNIYSGGVGKPEVGREDEVATADPKPGTLCKFPFIWPPDVRAMRVAGIKGKPQTECVTPPEMPVDADGVIVGKEFWSVEYQAAVDFFGSPGAVPLKPFCAATTNLEQDKQWGLCSCNMTQPGPVDFSLTFNLVFRKPPTEDSSKYFVYYPDLMLRSVTEGGMYPMSGPMESRTTLRLRGSNFSDAGQTIHCLFADRFGINTTRPAKRVDDELLECDTPAKTGQLDDMDLSIRVSITGNMQQFSESLPFMYYVSPSLRKIHPTADTTRLLQKGAIDSSYSSTIVMPAGPISGGTQVTIEGLRLLDKSRCSVAPDTGVVDMESGLTSCSSGGGSCPTQMQCQFPFYYQKQGSNRATRYDGCTEDDVQQRLGKVDPGTTWCMVNYRKPGNVDMFVDFDGDGNFEKSYMQCDCGNPVYTRLDSPTCGIVDAAKFPQYADLCPSTGTLFQVTKIECRFGHQFVSAVLQGSGNNGTDTIVCTSPPSAFGVRVPLTVTMNRVGYTKVEPLATCLAADKDRPCTYFQYLAPKPDVVRNSGGQAVALLSPTVDLLRIPFNVQTDMGGQVEREAPLYGPERQFSGCRRYFSEASVAQLGSGTVPTCTWSVAKDALLITLGEQPTFTFQTALSLEIIQTGLAVHKIHVSREPLVLVPVDPEHSDKYDGATQAGVDSRLRVRDGIITNDELAAVGVAAIPTDGSVLDMAESAPGLALVPQLSYLFEPSFACGGEEGDAEKVCPLQFAIEATGEIPHPVVRIDGIKTQDICTTETLLDARRSTGNLGRKFVMATWKLVSVPAAVQEHTIERVQTQLSTSFLKARIVCMDDDSLDVIVTHDSQLPGDNDVLCSSLAVGEYVVELSVTNWMGKSASGTFAWQRQTTAVGKVKIIGDSSKELPMGAALTLEADSDSSQCISDGEEFLLVYRWSIKAPGLSAEEEANLIAAFEASAIRKDLPELNIPPFALGMITGRQYVFVVELNQTYSGLSTIAMDEVSVTMKSNKPVARITGGSRTESILHDLKLSGAESHDPDVPREHRTHAGLRMCWGCTIGTCSGKTCSGVISSLSCPWVDRTSQGSTPYNGAEWIIPAMHLGLMGEYHATLTVARESDLTNFQSKDPSKTDLCEILYEAVAEDAVLFDKTTALILTPPERKNPPVSMILPLALPKYNPQQDLILKGHVRPANVNDTTSKVTYEWSIQPRPHNFEASVVTSLQGTSRGSIGLAVMSGALLQGQTYTISLGVIEGSMKASSHLRVVVNTPPVLGSFAVSPSGGTCLLSDFFMEAAGWVDEDLPVTVTFGFMDHSESPPVRVPLTSRGEKLDHSSRLPVGNEKDDYRLRVFCEVSDGLGAMRRAFCESSNTEDCLVQVMPWDQTMDELKSTASASMSANAKLGNARVIIAYFSVLSLTMKKGITTRRRAEKPDFSQDMIAGTLQSVAAVTMTADFRGMVSASLQTGMPLPKDVTFDYAKTALQVYDLLVADKTVALDKTTGDLLLKGLALTSKALSRMGAELWDGTATTRRVGARRQLQEAQKDQQEAQTKVFAHMTTTTTNIMRSNVVGMTQRRSLGEGVYITAARMSVASLKDSPIVSLFDKANNREKVTVPDLAASSVVNAALVRADGTAISELDFVALAFQSNPFEYMGTNASVRSKTLDLSFHEALEAADERAPTQIPIKNLPVPITMQLRVDTVPEPNVHPATGISRVVGCGVWDSAEGMWDKSTVTTFAPVKEAETVLTCKASHATPFAAIDMEAGCDDGVEQPLKENNKCGVCEDSQRPMQGFCDWQGEPCVHDKNKCGVCHISATEEMPMKRYVGAAKGSTTAVHLAARYHSGICDYQGNPCPNPATQEVSVCGLCVERSSGTQILTVVNQGICDCKDSGVPNGGASVDCCGHCEGNNKALDYCGYIAGKCVEGGVPPANVPCAGGDKCPVPRSIPTKLVCHIGASELVNRSCTGCDGIPRPELPWNDGPPALNMGAGVGGQRNDSCGVCGGDSSSCAGCDGVPNSQRITDVCQVCGGNGQSCAGCDPESSLRPTQLFCDSSLTAGKTVCVASTGAGSRARYNCACDYRACALTGLLDSGCDSDACSPGCDGVPGSAKRFDNCSRCGGDGSTCKGCDGVELSGRVTDSLGRCLLPFQHPVGCDEVVNSFKRVDQCGDCGGDGSRCAGQEIQCVDTSQRPDECGVCRDPTQPLDPLQMTCRGCDGKPFSGSLVDRCGECDGDGRSCENKLNCIVTPCEFLQRPNYQFSNDQRLDIWGRCLIYDECGVCGGSGQCPHEESSLDAEKRRRWVNDEAQVVTAVFRLDIDDSRFDDSKNDAVDKTLKDHIAESFREAAGTVLSKTEETVYAIESTEDVVLHKICGKEQVCLFCTNNVCGKERTSSSVSIAGISVDIRPVLQPANPTCDSGTSGSNAMNKWCDAGCKSCDVQAKTRPSSGFSDIYVRVVTNQRDDVRKQLRDVQFRQRFSTHMKTLRSTETVRMFWEVQPCFGYDVCGTWCGDGRGCQSCGICGRDTDGTCIRMDACGVCNGDGSSCKGCDGQPFSGLVFDSCRKCGGDNSTCLGCDGVVNSGTENDRCGFCNGQNMQVDACGCCPAHAPRCFNDPSDVFCPPMCAEKSQSCMGCDGEPHSGRAMDACGVCGGNNLCKFEVVSVVLGDSIDSRRSRSQANLLLGSSDTMGDEWGDLYTPIMRSNSSDGAGFEDLSSEESGAHVQEKDGWGERRDSSKVEGRRRNLLSSDVVQHPLQRGPASPPESGLGLHTHEHMDIHNTLNTHTHIKETDAFLNDAMMAGTTVVIIGCALALSAWLFNRYKGC